MRVGTSGPRGWSTWRVWPVMAVTGSLLAGAVVIQVGGLAGTTMSAQQLAGRNIAGMGSLSWYGHRGEALQGRAGVHPERRQTHLVHGVHERRPVSRGLAVSG